MSDTDTPDNETFFLTTKEHTTLEVMLERSAVHDETIRAILQRKLSNAIVTFREDISPVVATLNSRVSYRIDAGPVETRVIAKDAQSGTVGAVLPITNPRGLALLGLSEGQSMEIGRQDGGRETLTLQAVLYQPEAAQRQGGTADNSGEEAAEPSAQQRPRAPFLRVVHSSEEVPAKPATSVVMRTDNGFDDPGPSAA